MGMTGWTFALSLAVLGVASTRAEAVQGSIVYVDDDARGADDGTSWSDAYTSLRTALVAVRPDDEVWVATGTYVPGTTPASTFTLVDGVAVYGGFAGDEATLQERAGLYFDTVLSGALAATSSLHVITAISVGPSTILDGFRIRNGAGITHGPVGGSGLLIMGGAPRIVNCTIEDHVYEGPSHTAARGGAVFIDGGDPLFVDCDFRDNFVHGQASGGFEAAGDALGAAVFNLAGRPTFVRCRFVGNGAHGGMAIKLGPAGRAFGGAISSQGGLLTLAHCALNGNRAIGGTFIGLPRADDLGQGGAIHWTGEALLTHCSFSGNEAGSSSIHGPGDAGVGGAVAVDGAGEMIQCTVRANLAETTGGIHLLAGRLDLVNGIFWDNGLGEADQVHADPGAVIAVDYSCIQGLTGALGGRGNIGSDPLFAGADGPDGILGTADDLPVLSSGSPCIDAADNWSVPTDVFDFDGDGKTSEAVPLDLSSRPRFSDDPAMPDSGAGIKPLVDMGALEVQADHCQVNLGYQGSDAMGLCLCGDVLTKPGSSAVLSIFGIPADGPVAIFVGLTFDPTPLLAGTLVPFPPLVTLVVGSAGGRLDLPIAGTPGLPLNVYVQAAAKGGDGVVLSNAIEVVIGT
jgi:hypothetical protein